MCGHGNSGAFIKASIQWGFEPVTFLVEWKMMSWPAKLLKAFISPKMLVKAHPHQTRESEGQKYGIWLESLWATWLAKISINGKKWNESLFISMFPSYIGTIPLYCIRKEVRALQISLCLYVFCLFVVCCCELLNQTDVYVNMIMSPSWGLCWSYQTDFFFLLSYYLYCISCFFQLMLFTHVRVL